MNGEARRSAVLLLAALAAVASPVRAPAQAPGAATTGQEIEKVFADIGETAPGCAVGVIADHEMAYAKGFGLANLDYGLPITPRSTFYLGSIGKQFTAAAIVHAARAGHLTLDDPIQKWIPEIPEYDRPITVRHLIHHTSGIRDYLGLANLSGRNLEDVFTDDEVLELIANQRAPNFLAGDEYLYSNSGYFLLAEIVERATGMSLSDYSRKELLDPLGMERTRIHDDRRDVIPDRVVAYQLDDGEYVMDHVWNFDKVGSGGVYSSIEDLARWDRNYYTEEVGGAGFTEQLRERGVLANGVTIPYAFGLSHGQYRGLPTISHGGALAGFRSELLRFPDERTTVLVLCNFPTSDPAARARRVADVVLADRLAPVAAEQAEAVPAAAAEASSVQLTPAQLDAFTGHWRASIGPEVEIRNQSDGLIFIQGASRAPLRVVSETVLRLDAADIEMTLSEPNEGKYDFMSVTQRGQSFTARRFDPAAQDHDYSALVGEYYSEELDVIYRLSESDDGLMLSAPPDRQARVFVLEDGRVRTPLGVLELMRDGTEVAGFTIDAGRVRGVRFERKTADASD
jgi:CubicO group peptidase (beta-lactamase class C family)